MPTLTSPGRDFPTWEVPQSRCSTEHEPDFDFAAGDRVVLPSVGVYSVGEDALGRAVIAFSPGVRAPARVPRAVGFHHSPRRRRTSR